MQQSLFDDLVIVMTDIKSAKEMSDFLQVFFSKTELLGLSKRIGILKRLYSNYSYEEIQQELHVSSATISSVAQTKDDPATDAAIEKLVIHSWADQAASFIRRLFP